MMFFKAPQSSTPLISIFVYTRIDLPVHIFCTSSATADSSQADTIVVGRSTATSSAWVGPDRAATDTLTLAVRLNSSLITSDMVINVRDSRPLEAHEMIWPSLIYGAAFCMVCLTYTEETATIRRSLSRQSSSSSRV